MNGSNGSIPAAQQLPLSATCSPSNSLISVLLLLVYRDSVILTQRLILEPIRFEHATDMIDGLCDSQLYTFIPDDPPDSLEELQSRYRRLEDSSSPDGKEEWLNWIVFRQDYQNAIGYVQASVCRRDTSQVAYMIFQQHWCQGFATEAVAAVIGHVFKNYDTQAIEALIDTRNRASQRLVSNLGFSFVETIKEADFFKGTSSDEYRYKMLRQDWPFPESSVV